MTHCLLESANQCLTNHGDSIVSAPVVKLNSDLKLLYEDGFIYFLWKLQLSHTVTIYQILKYKLINGGKRIFNEY